MLQQLVFCTLCILIFDMVNMMVQSNFIFEQPFFFKMASYRKNVNYENLYLGVIWCSKHNGTIKFYFQPARFVFKMAEIWKMLTLSDFNENLYHGVIWFEKHNGTIKVLFRAALFSQAKHFMAYCYALVSRWAIQAPGSL